MHEFYYLIIVTVPATPMLMSVSRLGGSLAVINWIPLTPAEARGLLTMLEIAYEPVMDSTSECSSYDFIERETIHVMENLFEQRTANITGLEPNREYCIAIQVSTSGGESGFSNAIKLPRKLIMLSYSFSFFCAYYTVPTGSPFQVKLELPDDLKCFNLMVSKQH